MMGELRFIHSKGFFNLVASIVKALAGHNDWLVQVVAFLKWSLTLYYQFFMFMGEDWRGGGK